MDIGVICDGAWGTALAVTLVENQHNVTLWGPFPENVEAMRRDGENRAFLPGVSLPPGLKLTENIQEACTAKTMTVLAVPAQFMRTTLERMAEVAFDTDMLFVNVAKGLELETCSRMDELIREVLGKRRIVVLSGPSHAEEVARKVPTAVVASAYEQNDANAVQKTFMNERLRVYTSDDPMGVQLGGALKNVLALGVGFCEGLGLGDNSKAALMTRGIAEMARLGRAMGGRAETFAGLSGVGDLIVTCMSRHSRNRYVGMELGRGRELEDIMEEMGRVVAEGVTTVRAARTLAERVEVEVPIVNAVYDRLYEGKSSEEVVHDLMTRKPKPEQYGSDQWIP